MKNISRSDFLKTMGGLFIIPPYIRERPIKKFKPRLSFSTLGCPDWTLDQVIDFAAQYKYQGVEIRGIQRELNLTASPHFNSERAIAETLKKFNDKYIKIVALGSSCELHHQETAVRQKNIDEAKRFTEIAEKLDCPYVRVFPNRFIQGQSHDKTIEFIAAGLSELGNNAKGSGVKILMETHGDLLRCDDILKIMTLVDNKNTGIVWDFPNMWSAYRESPSLVYSKLGKYICHTHIKDLSTEGEKKTIVFPGKGDVPIFEAIDILAKNNYKGYLSFEWEKLWHPGIDEPEKVFAEYSEAINNHFSK